MSFFSKSIPNFPNFLCIVIHFIAVICCILNLANSSWEIGRDLEINSTFEIVSTKLPKVNSNIALSLPVSKNFTNFIFSPLLIYNF